MEKRIVILGAAESGVGASVLALKKGFDVFVSDGGKIAEKYKNVLTKYNIPFEEGKHSPENILNATEVIKSPGIPDKAAMVKRIRDNKIPVISEIEFAGRYTNAKMIGITGTNGKTTTTLLTHHILKKAGLNAGLAGNVGKSLAMQVAEENYDHYVIELSSFQLDGMYDFKCDIAVLTNITPDHLDRHRTLVAYAAAKARIVGNQTAEDLAVLNADDPLVAELADATPARVTFFSRAGDLGAGVCRRDDRLVWRAAGGIVEDLIDIADIPLFGEHNLENVCAALAVGRDLGIPTERMVATISAFAGVEHRLERVVDIDDVVFFNDSKATNTDAAIKAIEAFDGRPGQTVAILGGIGKGQDFSVLAPVARGRVRHAVLIGEAADEIDRALEGVCPTTRASSMGDAVRLAREVAEPGDRVVLAPACSSFDMFENFEHRGRIFKQEVEALARVRA